MSWSTYLGFPDGSLGNESACNRGEADAALIPCSGRSPRGRNGNPLQYAHLESPINRGTWWATLHRVARIQTRLSWATKLCLCSIAESVGQEVFIVFVARLGAPRVVPAVKNLPANTGALRDTGSIPGLGRSLGGDHGNPLQYSLLESLVGRLWAPRAVQAVKNLPANVGDLGDTGSIPGSGRSLGGDHGNPLQYSLLESLVARLGQRFHP